MQSVLDCLGLPAYDGHGTTSNNTDKCSEPHRQQIKAPFAWRASDFPAQDAWIRRFDNTELAEIDAAIMQLRTSDLPLGQIDQRSFPLPMLGPALAPVRDEIVNGRGFIVLRGLPVERYADSDVEKIFWGLGSHLGSGLCQNGAGDLLGHVFDRGQPYGTAGVRGHESNAYLPFHTDYSDIVGLLCLRRSKSGGSSSISSSVTVHNEILARRPDLLPVLYRGFHYIKREAELSENPATDRRIPIYGCRDGNVACRYLRVRIETAAARLGTPLTPVEVEALDLFDAITLEDGVHLDMDLEPGDMQLCNDYRTLHSRTGYEDWPEPARARHMLRLWLRVAAPNPLPDDFPASNGYARVGEPGFETARELGLVSLNDV